ncbi:DCC1-like thiol-disulfide oxidoreductase family protein [Roseovarius sp. CAU 1744]|uniref:thiol-disulfide oxidoreductase DCC family protein n=1 Tax=Roseovarius sp. CAU 1744 TaxID=3140368 RepID=UPI00325AE13C
MARRHNHNVSALPADLRNVLPSHVIVFDGECVLCSGFFRFMLRHDRQSRFHFVLAQSKLGTRLYRALDLPTDEFETNLVLVDGVIYQKLDAFAHAMRALGWPWRALSALRFLPGALKDPAYMAVARNRYSLFGRYQACMIPDAAVRARFLPGGWG